MRTAWGGLVVLAGLGSCGPETSTPPDAARDDAGTSVVETIDAGAREAAAADGAEASAVAPGDAGPVATPDSGQAACRGAALCDDFEHDSPGTIPAGWTVSMGCDPNTQDGPADGGGLLVGVDSGQHHGGTRSVRVVGGDSCGHYLVQTGAFAGLGAQLYARLWVLFSGAPTQNHNGFLSMATTGGDHLRLGFQDGVVAWNAQKSDATLPDMDPQGTSQSVSPAALTWTCLELHVDETSGHLEFWMNGQAVAGLGYDGGDVQGVDDQWARGAPSPAVPVSLGLGWLGLNDQRTVWFDDVALGGARIGCD